MAVFIASILSLGFIKKNQKQVTWCEHNEDQCYYGDADYANAFQEALSNSQALQNKKQII